jgi:hypothetical protein
MPTTANRNSSDGYNSTLTIIRNSNGVLSAIESFLLGLPLYANVGMAAGVGLFLIAFGYFLFKCTNRPANTQNGQLFRRVQSAQVMPLQTYEIMNNQKKFSS